MQSLARQFSAASMLGRATFSISPLRIILADFAAV
jgi:hypothetical protein